MEFMDGFFSLCAYVVAVAARTFLAGDGITEINIESIPEKKAPENA